MSMSRPPDFLSCLLLLCPPLRLLRWLPRLRVLMVGVCRKSRQMCSFGPAAPTAYAWSREKCWSIRIGCIPWLIFPAPHRVIVPARTRSSNLQVSRLWGEIPPTLLIPVSRFKTKLQSAIEPLPAGFHLLQGTHWPSLLKRSDSQ